MRKFTFLFSCMLCALFVNAQQQVFLETFGNAGKTSGNPRDRIAEYTDYDNGAPVTFTETVATETDFADIRATNNINTHVWFPAAKTTDLVISNIPAEGFENLKLSFDIATNYNGGASNVNMITLYCNDEEITVPSVELTAQNTYANSGEIALPNAETIKLRFLYTAENNPTGYGYRLDNIKITADGEGPGTSLNSNSADAPSFYLSGTNLMTKNLEDGTMVEVYNALGAKVQTSFVISDNVRLNPSLTKGLYIIKAGNYTQKIMF